MVLEIDHKVSKTASDSFWSLSKSWLPKIHEKRTPTSRKIPQFRSLREKLSETYVPKIKMDVGYLFKSTGDIIILTDLDSTPVNRFKPDEYTKLYESASVEVIISIIY